MKREGKKPNTVNTNIKQNGTNLFEKLDLKKQEKEKNSYKGQLHEIVKRAKNSNLFGLVKNID